jgi:DNA-binding transcriptional ArsR family regulator
MNSSTQKSVQPVTPNLAAIAGHPTRLRCWFLLAERTLTPKEIAEEVGLSLDHVSYHVRQLLKFGAIELVRTEPRRGATAHWYRTVTRPDMRAKDVGGLSKEQSHKNAGHIVQLQLADAASSFDAEIMVERPEHSLIRCPVDLDPQAFAEASELLDHTLDKLYEIQAACVERTTAEPESRNIPAMAHLNLFELPPAKDRVPMSSQNAANE